MTQRPEGLTRDEPLFNIGAVSRMTEIPETTLRAWERRYNFPKSARTAGGHRLYSQQEVNRLQWVKLRVDAGMQISQAVRALQSSEREGELQQQAAAQRQFQRADRDGNALYSLRARLVDALITHDPERARQVLAEVLALFPLELLILDVVGHAFTDIGAAWGDGRIDIATEHFASNHLRQQLVIWMQTAPPAYAVDPVVLACAPGELHEGGLLMMAALLRRLRWPVFYLGQTTPLADLATFVETINASIVVFAAHTEEPARALVDWTNWLPEAERTKRPLVCYGGYSFNQHPELIEQVPGTWLGKTVHEGVETLNRLLREINPRVW